MKPILTHTPIFLTLLVILLSCSEKKELSQQEKENRTLNKNVQTCIYMPQSLIEQAFPEAKEIYVRFVNEKYPRCRCEFQLGGKIYRGELSFNIGMQNEATLDESANQFGNTEIREEIAGLGDKAYYFGGKYSLYLILIGESSVSFQLQEIEKPKFVAGSIEGSDKKIGVPLAKAIVAGFSKKTDLNEQ